MSLTQFTTHWKHELVRRDRACVQRWFTSSLRKKEAADVLHSYAIAQFAIEKRARTGARV